MRKRKRIESFNTLSEIACLLSEGNPGALSVLMQVYKKQGEGYFLFMLNLDDMNIRGPQIWIGYKDFAKENIDTFINAVTSQSQEMIDVINLNYKEEQAVLGGASYWR